jgi:hypothetical protein
MDGKHASTTINGGYKEDNWGDPVSWELNSAREAEKRWRYTYLRVSCKSATVERRLYVCCCYSETVIITVLKFVAKI